MNDLILEDLKEQATIKTLFKDPDFGIYSNKKEFSIDLFAELIIRRCAFIAQDYARHGDIEINVLAEFNLTK